MSLVGQVTERAHCLCGLEVESAQEHRQTPQQHLLGLAQQVVRPIHQGPQGLLAREGGAAASGEQLESVLQAIVELGRDIERSRAVASSMASGIPSRRRQIEATTDQSSPGRAKLGSCDRARSTNSITAPEMATSACSIVSSGGRDKGGTR